MEIHAPYIQRMESFELEMESLTPNCVEEAVYSLAYLYEKHFLKDASMINRGYCSDFAKDLIDVVGRGQVCWWDEMDDVTENEKYWASHAFAKIDGIFYDSETPMGVRDWRDLHIYAG